MPIINSRYSDFSPSFGNGDYSEIYFTSSRKGGFSSGFYKGLNCGRGSNDKKSVVAKNLNYVSQKMSVKNIYLILILNL